MTTITREQMIIGKEYTYTSVTGEQSTGKIVDFKTQRGNDFRIHKFMVVEFETPASDGIYKWQEAIKIY